MEETNFDILRFRRCSDLYGNPVSVTIGRRNGKTEAFLRPLSEDPSPAPEPQGFEDNPKYYVNLNPVERRTFRKILLGQSVANIAKEEGIKRSSVYARICGNSKGQGGMIAKNFWVLLWWRLRQKT
ncbi:hypothetical protein [Paludibaculum fermentans]|uniref:hypothetical protein n=1 Tax=Paludibaculum fermentans TaxID=1473598 RepID=UPI003EB91F93